MRAETGVKSMKRILREACTKGDGLQGEHARIALMEYRNTPLRELNRSPAELLFGRKMRDLLQLKPEEWIQNSDIPMDQAARELAYAAKLIREGNKWAEHTKKLTPLTQGQDVLIQCQHGQARGKWNRSGRIIEKIATIGN